MERKIDIDNRRTLIVLYVMYSVGIIGHIIEPVRDFMLTLTPITLLFTGGLVLFAYARIDREIIQWFLFTYIMTFCLEVFGVKTGFIFGDYTYGDVLGFKIFETPIIIGYNWVLVILGSILISKQIKNKAWFVIIVAPALAVLFDIILEPVAMKLGYWNWEGGTIPLQNYLAWFIIAFLFTFYFVVLKIKITHRVAIHYFLIQLVFFMILNLVI